MTPNGEDTQVTSNDSPQSEASAAPPAHPTQAGAAGDHASDDHGTKPLFELTVRQLQPANSAPTLVAQQRADTAHEFLTTVAQDPAGEPDLDAYCDQCGGQVTESRPGWLWVDDTAAQGYLLEEQERRRQQAGEVWTPAQDPEFWWRPTRTSWRVVHADCDLTAGAGYGVEIDIVWTWPRLIAFTAHVMEKRWLPYTNWRELLRDAVSGAPDAKLRARRRDPGVVAFAPAQ